MALLPGVLKICGSAHMYAKSTGVRSWRLRLHGLGEHQQPGSPPPQNLLSLLLPQPFSALM